jgi:hypothetical protein
MSFFISACGAALSQLATKAAAIAIAATKEIFFIVGIVCCCCFSFFNSESLDSAAGPTPLR